VETEVSGSKIGDVKMKYLCPECMITLDDSLHCVECDGEYQWISKKNQEIKEK